MSLNSRFYGVIKLVFGILTSRKVRKNFVSYFKKERNIKIFYENDKFLVRYKSNTIHELMPVFYWDSVPNFGDVIGPYLISRVTGKQVLNIHTMRYSGIMAVGSILQLINREDMVVWGSGLISEPSPEQSAKLKSYNPRVLSVRGKETAKYLLKAGIDVPDNSMYGDPALILPLFYNPSINSFKKIGICPHYIHKSFFLKNINPQDSLSIIDVQSSMETVVNSIASSTVCISTSLHGLIVAQAYSIPWVWLEIVDNNLTGDDFKFRDFFSTINESQVVHIKVSIAEIVDLDFEALASTAILPDKLYNEELILKSLQNYLNESR